MRFAPKFWCQTWRTFWIGQHSIRPRCVFSSTMCDRCVRTPHVPSVHWRPCYTWFGHPIRVILWNKCLEWVLFFSITIRVYRFDGVLCEALNPHWHMLMQIAYCGAKDSENGRNVCLRAPLGADGGGRTVGKMCTCDTFSREDHRRGSANVHCMRFMGSTKSIHSAVFVRCQSLFYIFHTTVWKIQFRLPCHFCSCSFFSFSFFCVFTFSFHDIVWWIALSAGGTEQYRTRWYDVQTAGRTLRIDPLASHPGLFDRAAVAVRHPGYWCGT